MSLGTLLTGEIMVNGNQDILYNMSTCYKDGKPNTSNLTIGVDILHAAWQYADTLDSWWANLAKSLTNNIRINGHTRTPENGFYDGVAYRTVVYYRVRWLWLAPPAALVLLSTVFLVTTMVASRRSTTAPWKNRALPLLYAKLDGELQDREKQTMAQGERSFKTVGNEKVMLDDHGQAWVFRVSADEKAVH